MPGLCPGTTDHIRPPSDTASHQVTFTTDVSQKLTFPATGTTSTTYTIVSLLSVLKQGCKFIIGKVRTNIMLAKCQVSNLCIFKTYSFKMTFLDTKFAKKKFLLEDLTKISIV